jgi:DNA-binding IclR family transcriptional regulator
MVERAFRLLDYLADAEDGQTLTELARALGMSKGSLHGLLKTLESSGIVEQVEDRRYALGPRLYDLAQRYTQRAGLRRFALPAMRRLASSIGETILLGRVERDGVRIVERIEAQSHSLGLRISAERGTRVHLLAGATGRVILASWPRERREQVLLERPLPRFTAHSITDPEAYLVAVDEAARTGIGVDHEEYLTGVNAVAAPIYGPGDGLVALLWTVGFSGRFSGEALQRAVEELRAEAAAISRALGAGPAALRSDAW